MRGGSAGLRIYRLMVIRKGVFLCFLSVGARCFFFLLLDGLGDHFGVLFETKMWLKQYVFVCFCLGGPSGVSLVSFICFGLAWVAIWGPHGVLLGVLLLFLWIKNCHKKGLGRYLDGVGGN